jgi:hypothetical protein
MYYWEIVDYEGNVTYIPPDAVEKVRKKREAGLPIQTTSGDITPNQIKHFRVSNRPYNQVPLLEAVSEAFNEPLLNEDGSIVYRWVKKLVPSRLYQKHYSALPSYHSLGEQNGMAWIAFKQPVHQVNTNEVEYCTEDEIKRLTT